MQEVREGQGEGLSQAQSGYGSTQDERMVFEQPREEKRVQPIVESDSKRQQTKKTALDNILIDISCIDKKRIDRTRNDKRQHTTAVDSRNVTIRRTASSVRIRERLCNGQLLSEHLLRRRNMTNPQEGIHYIWSIGLHIRCSRKEANRWYHMPYAKRIKNVRQSGECGLEGLRKALNYLVTHCEAMGEREELQIYCDDAKRFNAYRYLLKRYRGFTEHEEGQGEKMIAFLHPQYWKWNAAGRSIQ